MSGSQIGGVIGGVIGFVWGGGNWQAGYAIGSAIGGAIDPDKIKVPGIKDLPTQTAGEGSYRQVVYGTSWINQTNIIDFGEVRRVKHRERQGKGGGPVVESERLYRTYAIGLGEPFEAVRMIRRNGKIVYDVRPGSTILADSAAFAERFTFYSGSETQLPDPDLEALPHNGVGNTPYHRGTAYMVFPNDDLTDDQGRIPTYEVEGVGIAATPVQGAWFYGPVAENGASGGSEMFYLKASTPTGLYAATPVALPAQGSSSLVRMSIANGAVFMHRGVNGSVSFDNGATWAQCSIGLSSTLNVFWDGSYYFNDGWRSADGITWSAITTFPGTANRVSLARPSDGAVVCVSGTGASTQVYVSTDSGATWTMKWAAGMNVPTFQMTTNGTRIWFDTAAIVKPYYTDDLFTTVAPINFNKVSGKWIHGNDALMISAATRDLWRMPAGGITPVEVIDNIYNGGANNSDNIAYGGGLWAAENQVNNGVTPRQRDLFISSDDGFTWAAGGGTLYGTGGSLVHIPIAAAPTIDAAPAVLSSVVADICDRCGIPSTQYQFSALTDEMLGVTLGGAYDGASTVALFFAPYSFDIAQPDKAMVAVKRGAAVVSTITADDFIEGPDESILRGQDIEYPRALMLKYLDAEQNYAAPAATVSRTTPDSRVNGEATMEMPISIARDEAFEIADKSLKVMWEDLNGEIEFAVPSGRFCEMVPTDCYGLSLRGGLYRIRITEVTETPWQLKVKARRDRQSAYTSALTGIPLPAPTPPPPALPGVTTFAVMDIPALVDADDSLGIYVAVTGQPNSAWYGATIEYSTDGGSTYTSAGTITFGARMGELTAALPYAPEAYPDYVNTLAVELVTGDDLESVTQAQFLSEGNPAAICYGNGTAEIVQFRDAANTAGNAWDLTTLQRGRLGTSTAAHASGEQFVFLEDAFFVPLPSSLIGQTIKFRITSLGTSPEVAPTEDVVWNAACQTELPPANLLLDLAGTDLACTAVPRHRFGTEDAPVASINFRGYRWTATDGVNSATADTTDAAYTFDVTGWASPVTVTVAQLNRWTGAGPSISENT